MARLSWSETSDRIFETGLDRGVLYPSSGSVVPWNGLTAVDEGGGDDSQTYFIEGRPYLHLPKPKEYTATIKAYTYPDEFSSVMGLAESVDGMYLDSQMGDSFGLSYRSLIGNMVDGTRFGYKIHIVYNATVVPPSVSHASLSGDVNPTEFSWDIKAVPIPIEGYRPTAHVVIDTRHLDAGRLAELEAILYGDHNTAPALPTPQDIHDILTFNNEIIITDYGDGTWSAEGPSENVRMLEDGVFEINHVTAIDNNDGTFYISSTTIVPPPTEPGDTDVDGGGPGGDADMIDGGGVGGGTSTDVWDGGVP